MVFFHSTSGFIVLLVTLSILFPLLSFAAPAVNPQRTAKKENIDKSIQMEPYTWDEINDEEWLRSQMLRKPLPGKCIFYTTALSDEAQEYVKGSDTGRPECLKGYSETIWDMWPAVFYADAQEPWNPFRVIRDVPESVLKDHDKYVRTPMRQYFKLMSKILASECTYRAGVMTTNFDLIPANGIWHETERPELMDSRKRDAVGWIDILNPSGTQVEIMWTRPGGWQNGFNPTGKRVPRPSSAPHKRWVNGGEQRGSKTQRRRRIQRRS